MIIPYLKELLQNDILTYIQNKKKIKIIITSPL